MKVRKGLQYNEVCGIAMLVPVGDENADFSNVTSLNETSMLLWKRMEKGEFTKQDLVDELTANYEVDAETASNDVETLLGEMLKAEIIEE